MRYHLTPVRMAIMNTLSNNKCWWGYWEREPLYTVGGIVNYYSHYGKQCGGSLKISNIAVIKSSNSTSGDLSEEI